MGHKPSRRPGVPRALGRAGFPEEAALWYKEHSSRHPLAGGRPARFWAGTRVGIKPGPFPYAMPTEVGLELDGASCASRTRPPDRGQPVKGQRETPPGPCRVARPARRVGGQDPPESQARLCPPSLRCGAFPGRKGSSRPGCCEEKGKEVGRESARQRPQWPCRRRAPSGTRQVCVVRRREADGPTGEPAKGLPCTPAPPPVPPLRALCPDSLAPAWPSWLPSRKTHRSPPI